MLSIFLLVTAPWSLASSMASQSDLTGATYVDSKVCSRCHKGEHLLWSRSLHSKMIQKFSPEIALGNFDNQTLEHMGWRFTMFKKNRDYFIREVPPNDSETLYKVDYTLGSKRIQHYLSTRSDGSIRVTFPTWDVATGQWIHGSEIVRGAHNSTGELVVLPIQIWNKYCWNCHTSQEEEGFDINTDTYKTTFTETGINCDMCHGPGSLHVQRMDANPKDKVMAIVNPAKLPPRERMVDCLQCHTRRVMIKKGFHVGQNYYDYYMPKLVELTVQRPSDPPVWADRHRRFANETLLLWQTKCFLKGNATCFFCHDPHNVNIAEDKRYQNTDVLCLQCHREYRRDKVVSRHTRHSLKGKGSRCVECHMLLITEKNIKLLQNAHIRDHNISSIPIPENTLKHNIPNACSNVCHADKNLEWVVEWMDKWYPKRPRVDRVEDALALARQRNPQAIPLLMELLNDPSQDTWVRGSAASFLGEFEAEKVAPTLIRALDDPDVVIRAEAARSLSEVRSPASVDALMKKLSDNIRIVRLNAVFSLMKMAILQLDGPQAEAFKKAKGEYQEFLYSFPTVYETRVDLGTYLALHGNYEEALKEYVNARKLRPEAPLAHYYIGVTSAQLGLFDAALWSFQEALALDPNFRNTRQLIEQVLALRRKP